MAKQGAALPPGLPLHWSGPPPAPALGDQERPDHPATEWEDDTRSRPAYTDGLGRIWVTGFWSFTVPIALTEWAFGSLIIWWPDFARVATTSNSSTPRPSDCQCSTGCTRSTHRARLRRQWKHWRRKSAPPTHLSLSPANIIGP